MRRQDSLREQKPPEEEGPNLDKKLPQCFTYSAAEFHKSLDPAYSTTQRRKEACSDIADESRVHAYKTQESSFADKLINKILEKDAHPASSRNVLQQRSYYSMQDGKAS